MSGHAELADEEHVERRRQRPRHFEGDGHPTTRQAEYNDSRVAGIRGELFGEKPPGFPSVAKDRLLHGSSFGARTVTISGVPTANGIEFAPASN
jgi:hypothetical protein